MWIFMCTIGAAPIAHWALDEQEGEKAFDSKGTYDGTLLGNAYFKPGQGKSGGAVNLGPGTDAGYVLVGNVLSLTGTDFTIAVWVKTDDSSNLMCPVSKHWPGYLNGYFLLLNNDENWGEPEKACFYHTIHPGREPVSMTTVTDGNWHHVVAVHIIGGNTIIYVDGTPAEESKLSGSIGNNNASFLIGALSDFSGNPVGHYSGLLDDLQVYNHALTDTEIQFMYDNPGQDIQSAGFSAPLAHWKFDETEGLTAFDNIGDFNGTLHGNINFVPEQGISGGAIKLDREADSGVVSMGDILSYSNYSTGDFSISAWVESNQLQEAGIVAKHYSGWPNGYSLGVTNGTGAAHYFHSGTMTYGTSNTLDGMWHHLVGIYDEDGYLDVYVDGNLEGRSLSSPINSEGGAHFVLGGNYQNTGPKGFYKGMIDDVQVYDYTLSHDDVLFLFNNPGLELGVTNQAPIANAGENLSLTSYEASFSTVAGTAFDEDSDDILTYRWLEGQSILLDWMEVGQNGESPLDLSIVSLQMGAHFLTLEVNDGKANSSDEMILTIDNSSPNAGPTGGGVYEIGAEVVLGGNVSDYDGDLLSYQWIEGHNVISSGTVQSLEEGTPVSLPSYLISNLALGIHTISLQVSDGTNDPIFSVITVEIVDITVPTIVPSVNKTILWPPNHKMEDIIIEANTTDNSGFPVSLSVMVSSNEPQDGLGDGDMTPDWTEPFIDQENGIISLQLRAERSGTGDGREYKITITATDSSGNSSTADVIIIVPHDKRKN